MEVCDGRKEKRRKSVRFLSPAYLNLSRKWRRRAGGMKLSHLEAQYTTRLFVNTPRPYLVSLCHAAVNSRVCIHLPLSLNAAATRQKGKSHFSLEPWPSEQLH